MEAIRSTNLSATLRAMNGGDAVCFSLADVSEPSLRAVAWAVGKKRDCKFSFRRSGMNITVVCNDRN